MAYSTIHPFKKTYEPKNKRSDAKLKHYPSADRRLWVDDKFERSMGLQDVLTRESSTLSNSENLNKEELLEKIDRLLREIIQKDRELDEIHELYKSTSNKLKELEKSSRDNPKYQILLQESQDELAKLKEISTNSAESIEVMKERASQCENLVQERDMLKDQVQKLSNVETLIKKLKERADEADVMEDEISRLKRELQKCGHGASGDKMKVQTDKNSAETECDRCQRFRNELSVSKTLLDTEEKRVAEIEAERNFLRNRLRMIEVLEAELLVYKIKYEESECTLLKLKEMLIKAEINERSLNDSNKELTVLKSQLQESEQQNQKWVAIIESLDKDLKERDIYIESINNRIIEDGIAKRAINFDAINPGKVQSIVQKFSSEMGVSSMCKCKIENCKCASLSSSSMASGEENVIESVDLCSKSTIQKLANESRNIDCDDILTISEFNRLKEELSCKEVKHLQRENEELCKEIVRLKSELHEVLQEMEGSRDSNSKLESELRQLYNDHEANLVQEKSKFERMVCEKIDDLQALQQQLNAEMEKTHKMEEKISAFSSELCTLREFRKCCEKIDECHCQKLRELENLRLDCTKSCEENALLRCKISELNEVIKCYRCNEQMEKIEEQKRQKRKIMKSVGEFRKHFEQKVFMIRCYEDKIQQLEAENESLRCFRDKFLTGYENNIKIYEIRCNDSLLKKAALFGLDSLDYDQILELNDRVQCVLLKNQKSTGSRFYDADYSKLIDDICEKYQKDAAP